MPYQIKKQGSQYVVTKKSGGRVLGTHSSKARAQAQVRAIYANEGEKKK